MERCWMARTPLSLLIEHPKLLAFLEPMGLATLMEQVTSACNAANPYKTLGTLGTLGMHA